MGVKSKVRSMQRGAHKRSDEAPVTNAELYKVSPPLLTDDELAHFKFGNRSIDNFFLGLSDILQACHHNRMSAADVAKILNAQKARTACGDPWSPRLAWFLMKTWRTVYFQKLEMERQRRQASKTTGKPLGEERASHSTIDRAVARQQAQTYQRVLRNYFKNPTLGEIFPELGVLKQSLLSRTAAKPVKDGTPIASSEPCSILPVAASAERPISRGKTRPQFKKSPRQPEPRNVPLPAVQLTGTWKDFFSTQEGRSYLVALIRSNPRLLILAQEKDSRFLGSLRALKSAHPSGKYWMEADAEQVRSAILAGIHSRGNPQRVITT